MSKMLYVADRLGLNLFDQFKIVDKEKPQNTSIDDRHYVSDLARRGWYDIAPYSYRYGTWTIH